MLLEPSRDKVLWLLGEDKKVTEAGAMNFFVVIKRDDDSKPAIFLHGWNVV
jgi:branched-subunit amino acid aminotransferase/4-amino-4-deoxychorismate lyase